MKTARVFFAIVFSIALVFMLGLGGCGSSNTDESANVTAEANNDPVADAGPDQDVYTGTVVQLDGSGSYDPKDGQLTYSWSIVNAPAGSNAALSNSTAVDPAFTADLDGTYVVSLTVYTNKSSLPDTVTVTSSGPGTLDPTFGTGGVVTYDSGYNYYGISVAIQSDGKALVAGSSDNGSNTDLMLLRYNTDGMLDTTFGTGGMATYDGGYNDLVKSVAIQSDGKALVAGLRGNGYNDDLVLLRFNTDGTLDTTFGTGGVATYDSGYTEYGYSVAVQSDGKALVAGSRRIGSNTDLVLLRFNTDGTLDTTFGTSGVAAYNGSYYDYGYSVAVQSDGKALVAGEIYNNGTDIVLLRYNTNGTRDTTFGTMGVATYDSGYNDNGFSVTVQSDGKALVAGSIGGPYGGTVLLRYNTNGTLDPTFGTSGVVTYGGGGYSFNKGFSVTVQSDGKALVAGVSSNGSNNDLVLLRVNTDGTLDTTFGTGGVATYDSGYTEYGYSVAVQSDGKALVAGSSGDDIVLVRFK